ncbi:uncharacterized protein F5Z01DRAFT_428304 [Emericellopsis atlantica]|uniref:DUF6590 domain-containing protein n=1 Tax=Emericellopsis atlantica TaxID=2614577 RepID=A0A9P7ZEC4_9HYPO|nr:uncharacterized protein F5Z01DRAFT_428304 [Emericellopsis atlantica]KAG9250112.1 hypothetical protein F5Z01DRAFT_428304 [Emericellopsis atlantica]
MELEGIAPRYPLAEMAHQSFQRIVVVKTEDDSSFCCPISTYGGEGCVEKALLPEIHGIIYDIKHEPPTPLAREEKLVPPVGAVMYGEHTLPQACRLNYFKGFWIQHNIPVMFTGKIPTDQMEMVKSAVRLFVLQDTEGKTTRPSLDEDPSTSPRTDAIFDDPDTTSQGEKDGESSKSRHTGH